MRRFSDGVFFAVLTARLAIFGGRLSDHHDRFRLRYKAYFDGAFLVFNHELVSDMEPEGFEPFALHLDFRVIGVSAASIVSAISAAAGILNLDLLCFCHIVSSLLKHCDEAVCLVDLCQPAAVTCQPPLSGILFQLVLVMAPYLPDAGAEGFSMPMLMHGRSLMMCVQNAKTLAVAEILAGNVPAMPGVVGFEGDSVAPFRDDRKVTAVDRIELFLRGISLGARLSR